MLIPGAETAWYHTPAGYHAVTLGGFDGQGVKRTPLHAPPNGVAGANGIFA
jgi:hypothetical protein